MNKINSQFSIKDLENLSGVKAHTIRIWEKRYNILTPSRTKSNVRFYDITNLQKLLNVSLLYNAGYKISKIAALEIKELQHLVREQFSTNVDQSQFLDALKMSMLNFDQTLFEHTYNRLVAESTFKRVFLDVLVPFLFDIGLHWQSDAITPAHEHFISNLIKQKLHINIERAQQLPTPSEQDVYVLFLPVNEIHELGLLYIHYEIILKGHTSIFLGQSVPMENLKSVQSLYPKVNFISYFTVQPTVEEVDTYLEDLHEQILKQRKDNMWALGRNTQNATLNPKWENMALFNNIEDMLNKI